MSAAVAQQVADAADSVNLEVKKAPKVRCGRKPVAGVFGGVQENWTRRVGETHVPLDRTCVLN